MNKVILMGRLVRDPDVRYSQGEKPMAITSYSLAVDRKFKQDGQPTADFINCKAFGKNGEFAEKYLHKGTKILIEGRIQTGSYTNKDGVKVFTTDVVVDNHEFAESKNSNSQSDSQNRPDPMQNSNYGFMNIDINVDEELPFQ